MICKLLVAQFEIYSEEDIYNPQDNDKLLSIDINSQQSTSNLTYQQTDSKPKFERVDSKMFPTVLSEEEMKLPYKIMLKKSVKKKVIKQILHFLLKVVQFRDYLFKDDINLLDFKSEQIFLDQMNKK